MSQKKAREGRVYWAYTSILQSIIEGRQDKNSNGRNLEAGAEEKTVEACSLLTGSTCLAQLVFLELRTTSSGVTSPTMCWSLPHQSVIKEILSTGTLQYRIYKLAYSSFLWRLFLNWGFYFFLSDDYRVFQVNINLVFTNTLVWKHWKKSLYESIRPR